MVDSESVRELQRLRSPALATRNQTAGAFEGRVRFLSKWKQRKAFRLIGDFGYDPLNLGKNPDALRWYVQAELIHCRLAMMGLAGMLIPSVKTNLSNSCKFRI